MAINFKDKSEAWAQRSRTQQQSMVISFEDNSEARAHRKTTQVRESEKSL